jgi:hypothetical protein
MTVGKMSVDKKTEDKMSCCQHGIMVGKDNWIGSNFEFVIRIILINLK